MDEDNATSARRAGSDGTSNLKVDEGGEKEESPQAQEQEHKDLEDEVEDEAEDEDEEDEDEDGEESVREDVGRVIKNIGTQVLQLEGEDEDYDRAADSGDDDLFIAEIAQYRIPDFLVVRTEGHSRHVLAFWEIKDCHEQDLPPTVSDKLSATKIMRATLPQLVQQAQFVFETFPEQKSVVDIFAIGLLFNYFIFKRGSTPPLPTAGNKLKLLSPREARAVPTNSREQLVSLYNKSGTDYSKIFKNCWTIARRVEAE